MEFLRNFEMLYRRLLATQVIVYVLERRTESLYRRLLNHSDDENQEATSMIVEELLMINDNLLQLHSEQEELAGTIVSALIDILFLATLTEDVMHCC
ncbi:hypothetical protein T11_14158 [Trichinella zimbabwensis]|uniref:Uncharacterized protein n=1 Tax=Trichinella zimbabwensis TaxID=268475 RepID=A0A0V1H956_9BILA|nr:hypothetical protein T11_14158 [Trichinella zimbabwensis]